MATLAESFLADLDDLSDASGDEDLDARDGDGDIQVAFTLHIQCITICLYIGVPFSLFLQMYLCSPHPKIQGRPEKRVCKRSKQV